MSLTLNTGTGVVTSQNTANLRIVQQTASNWWNRPLGQYVRTLPLNGIDRIVLHHTVTGIGSQSRNLADIENWWPTWHSPGYHFVIQANGDVWQLQRINRVANGANPPGGGVDNNIRSIHIALIGTFNDGNRPSSVAPGIIIPNQAQRTAVQRLVAGLINLSALPNLRTVDANVFDHNSMPQMNTSCNGMSLANARRMALGQAIQTTAGNTQGNDPGVGTGPTFIHTMFMTPRGNFSNVRSGNSNQSPVTTTVPHGAVMEVQLAQGSGWHPLRRFTNNANPGANAHVHTSPTYAQRIDGWGNATRVVIANNTSGTVINARERPFDGAAVTVPNGTRLTIRNNSSFNGSNNSTSDGSTWAQVVGGTWDRRWVHLGFVRNA